MSKTVTEAVENWKAHPVIVALAAGAATCLFCITFVVPVFTQALRNEIAFNAESVAKARATEERANSLERQLKEALGKIRALEKPNTFSLGNPYPVGLGLVKTGQPIEDLSKAYPSATIKKSTKYWELNKFHSVFGDVTFYFDDRTKKITHIAFYCEGIASFTNRLVEILGPHTSSPQKDFYHWKTDAKVSVFVGPPSGAAFLIMGEGLEPSWWPKK